MCMFLGTPKERFFAVLLQQIFPDSLGPISPDDSCVGSKVWFVFLDFNHQMMEVYELRAHRQTPECWLGEDLMETMIVLDELGQRSLVYTTRQEFITFKCIK